ncbi:PREDICTED: uncharacterized protein LOC104826984 [Tarenaya hassleriana]|uniref:uncharacterized protein LOC104826984 n=1 Tax=Tarenaya hassleriana TaxID=28532 RepID=UPI00053C9D84|nr:PREDICTED: uncharacterized protein LOC104826984 [Tarenaya hassleriana]XP_010558278.1 PREDICTED: uncharacterized protein LOC104826984 [Tarenaya hassleriana]XP_010558280.1 PREDICTED: uncharacterized protein LOC104826984 [Tarenaya hassleriana]XP_019059668.1 PREDICTED: uncharacterized protein LOC104826984 [Tarenaya hassleriana]
MSTGSDMDTDTVNSVNASSSGGGNELPSETLVDKVSGEVQVGVEEVEHGARDELEAGVSSEQGCGSSVSAGDDTMDKRSECTDLERKTDAVNRGFDLEAETQNVDVEIKCCEKKFPSGSGEILMANNKETMAEKDSDGIRSKLLADKEAEENSHDAMEQETIRSDSINPGDERDSDVRLQDSCSHGNVNGQIHLDRSETEDMEIEDKEGKPAAGLKLYKSEDAKPNFSDSDLVWAKVRSHPWWPGQKFDASDASEKAKKYFKKGTSLVTYFGDHTFAWNDPSRIKPFHQHFSQLEKQSNLAEFRHAIDCALEEVSRRTEFGLACPCISEEVYNKIKTQNVINPGIREESSVREGGDSISSASFFEPAKLVEYIKIIACTPSYSLTDKLHFTSHRAQLLAFHRWKGYPDLPQFEKLRGSVESAPKVAPPGVNKDISQVAKPKTVEQVSSEKRRIEENNESGQKQRGESDDRTGRNKKEKTLIEFIAEKRRSKSKGSGADDKSDGKQFPDRKRKAEFSESDKSIKRIKKNNLPLEDLISQDSAKKDRKGNLSGGDTNKPQKPKPVFGIGASILRVASQMNSSTPTLLKPCSGSTPKMVAKNNTQEKRLSMKPDDVKDYSEEQILPEKKSEATEVVPDIPTKDNGPTEVEKLSGSASKEHPGTENSAEECSDNSCEEDCYEEDEDAMAPNALILNFTDLDSVPSVEKLNKIFSRYGALRESETEVMKKSKKAKVVFKRGEDAETAFSSAGKYSIFGPSLLSYRLKHVALKPTNRDRKLNNNTKVDA